MHEMSIAVEVCRMAEAHVGRDRLANVIEVGLDVGCDAGVEVDNLEFCLEALLSNPPFGRAKPIVEQLPGDVLRMTYLELDE